MEITLKGPIILINLNGVLVNRFDSNDENIPERKVWSEPERGKRPEIGYIGLQNEDHVDKKQDSHVYFKEISVKPLNN